MAQGLSRRGLLAGIIASAAAPVFIPSQRIMRIRPVLTPMEIFERFYIHQRGRPRQWAGAYEDALLYGGGTLRIYVGSAPALAQDASDPVATIHIPSRSAL